MEFVINMFNWCIVFIYVFKIGVWLFKWFIWEKFFDLNKKDFDVKYYCDVIYVINNFVIKLMVNEIIFLVEVYEEFG